MSKYLFLVLAALGIGVALVGCGGPATEVVETDNEAAKLKPKEEQVNTGDAEASTSMESAATSTE
ncbi:MAG: hypothetical protein AMXMBFR81_28450 [Chthonomonas sp.]|nr:hypothetical protein [Fimbriimonadaceae bacterium]